MVLKIIISLFCNLLSFCRYIKSLIKQERKIADMLNLPFFKWNGIFPPKA